MDFNKHNSRVIAENGSPMTILDPWTGEPMMDGDNPCRVIVRGTASPSAQRMILEQEKRAMTTEDDDTTNKTTAMENLHSQLCRSARHFIIGFEHVDVGDRPATVEDVDWFLDLSFPEMGVKTDANGRALENENGELVFELKNNPFAKQITEFAKSRANRLGNEEEG